MIQRRETKPSRVVHRVQSEQKNDSIQDSLVDETGPRAKKLRLSERTSRIDKYMHEDQ